jgi:peptide/nickel transport system substrate-binding protein
MTHALDRTRIIDDILLGEARALSAPFFPTMFGADPSIAPYAFDLSKATKLFDDAGHPSKDGVRFTVDLIALQSQRNASVESMMAIFRRDLKSVGINLKVSFLPTRAFFNRVVMRDFDGAYFGWLPDIPDPDPYALLHSSQMDKAPIHAGYANTAVDSLLDDARRTANRDERKALYHRVHALVHADEPYTMLYAEHGRYAWSRRLRGVNPKDIGPQPRFPGIARWWITAPSRPGAAAKPRQR